MHALAILLIAATTLTACRHDRKPDLPATTVVQPEVVVVERRVYVAIPPRLTQPLSIAEGPIAQCFAVAAKRRAALEKANARLYEIAQIEGTPVAGGEVEP